MAVSNVGQGGVHVIPGSAQTEYPQWLGFYYATVASNADPLALGRVQLRIPQVLGTEISTWAWALASAADPTSAATGTATGTTAAASGTTASTTTATTGGATSPGATYTITPPAVGTVVAVTFLGGDLSQPAYLIVVTNATTGTTAGTGGTTTTAPAGTAGGSTGGSTSSTGGGTPSISTTSLPAATSGSPYSQSILASGGVPPYTWSLASGALPTGLSLNTSAGVISGTATAAGPSTFSVTLTDSAGNTVTVALTMSATTLITGAAMPVGPPGTWTLAFEDLFPGTSLNTSNWTALEGASINGLSTQASAVSVSGGYLRIGYGGAVNSNPASGYAGPSTGPAVVLGNCIEAKINFPGPSGDTAYNWPAWWSDGSSWPTNGEEDIFEGYGDGTPSAFNYHNHSGANNGPLPSGSWCNSFHTYTLVRGSTTLSVYWDGVLMRSLARDDSGGAQAMIINQGNGNVDNSGAVILVEYVRMWTPG